MTLSIVQGMTFIMFVSTKKIYNARCSVAFASIDGEVREQDSATWRSLLLTTRLDLLQTEQLLVFTMGTISMGVYAEKTKSVQLPNQFRALTNQVKTLPNQIKAVPNCLSRPCNSNCILSHLEPQDRETLKSLQTLKIFSRNETIFREGDAATGLYLVCKGMVKLSKAHSDGYQFIVRIVSPGHFFGLPPLICNRSHFTTAQAVDRVTLEYVPREKFMEFLKSHPDFTIQLIDKVANELCLARTRLRDFGCKNGRQRLADLLLWLEDEFGRPSSEGVELDIELSRIDIAGMTGLTSETTIRLLSSFRSEGLISTSRKRIIILDHERLRLEVGSDLLVDHANIFDGG